MTKVIFCDCGVIAILEINRADDLGRVARLYGWRPRDGALVCPDCAEHKGKNR